MSRIYQAAQEAERARREAIGRPADPPVPGGTRAESTGVGVRLPWATEEVVSEYQMLRIALHSMATSRSSRAVMICGSTWGEGASTVAAGLALISAADNTATTLLIDTNLRSPEVHRRFHVRRSPGLSNALADGRTAAAEVVRGPIRGLSLLPAGGARLDPVAAYKSDRFDSLLRDLEQIYDYVILDSPPVNSCPETLVLGEKVGGVVLIVRAERTRIEVAAAARDKLTNSRAHICGVVLNGRRYYIPEFVYRRL